MSIFCITFLFNKVLYLKKNFEITALRHLSILRRKAGTEIRDDWNHLIGPVWTRRRSQVDRSLTPPASCSRVLTVLPQEKQTDRQTGASITSRRLLAEQRTHRWTYTEPSKTSDAFCFPPLPKYHHMVLKKHFFIWQVTYWDSLLVIVNIVRIISVKSASFIITIIIWRSQIFLESQTG